MRLGAGKTLWALSAAVAGAVILSSAVASANVRSHALYARGLVPFNNGKWEDAYRLFDQAVHADEKDAVALYYRGLTQSRRGNAPAAIQDMEQALKLNPLLPHAALDIGVAYFNTAQYEAAKPWLERAHREGSERHVAAFFLGLALYRLGDNAAALTYFNEAKADPEVRPTAEYYAGLLLQRQGDAAAARTELEQSAREQPQSEVGQAAQRYVSGAEVRHPPPPGTKEGEKPWSVAASLGFQYDTNVVIAPSDSALKSAEGISREADGRTVIAAGAKYTFLDTDVGSVRGSYDFYQSIHFRLTEFDLQGHRVRLELASKPGTVSYGLAGTYDFYALDYQTFFQEALGTPWVSFAEGSDAATQLYYTVRGRDFFRKPYDPGRDAIDHAFGVRQYLALGDAQRLLSVGYQFDSEDTVSNGPMGNDFEYSAHQADVGLALPVIEQLRVELAYLFRLEDYQFVNSRPNSDGSFVRRHDAEHEFVAGLAYDLTPELALTFDFLGVINGSNIPNFDYDRDIVSVGARVTF